MSDENGGDWVSVSEVAAARGISERAIQKQCKAGKLRAQLVTTESGTQWQIAAAEIAQTPKPNELKSSRTGEPNEPVRARTDEPSSRTDEPSFESARTKSGEPTNLTNSEVREPNEPSSRTNERTGEPDMIAHLIEENRFLRGVVESQARDMAETRAALRTALAAMPKAITASASSGSASADHTAMTHHSHSDSSAAKPVEIAPQVLAADEKRASETMLQVLAETQAGEFKTRDGTMRDTTGEGKEGHQNSSAVHNGRKTFRRWLLEILRG